MRTRVRPNIFKVGVRININFLDRPLAPASTKLARSGTFCDQNGFTISVAENMTLPTLFDKQLLYILIARAQMFDTNTIELRSINKLCSLLGLIKSSYSMARVKDSLLKWLTVNLIYDNHTFYCKGKRKECVAFKVFDVVSFTLDDNKKGLVIVLNDDFMKQNISRHSMTVNLPTLMMFNNHLSLRLYEILVKNFNQRTVWKIKLNKLINKLGIDTNTDYWLDNYTKIRKSLDEINMLSGILKEVRVAKTEQGEVVVFRLHEKVPKTT